MTSVPLPKAARGAVFVAFLIAVVSGLSVRSGPIMLLAVCLVAAFAAVGILLRQVWSAYGFALLLALSILAMIFFALTGQSAGSILQMLISIVLYSGVAGLFVLAGLSLKAAGGRPGSPIPWILIALVLSVPFIVFRPVSVFSSSMAPTLLIGDFVLVNRFATRPAIGDLVAYRDANHPDQIRVGRVIARVAPESYQVTNEAKSQSTSVSGSAVVGKPNYIYDSLAPDRDDVDKEGELTAPTHPPLRRWDRLFKAVS